MLKLVFNVISDHEFLFDLCIGQRGEKNPVNENTNITFYSTKSKSEHEVSELNWLGNFFKR